VTDEYYVISFKHGTEVEINQAATNVPPLFEDYEPSWATTGGTFVFDGSELYACTPVLVYSSSNLPTLPARGRLVFDSDVGALFTDVGVGSVQWLQVSPSTINPSCFTMTVVAGDEPEDPVEDEAVLYLTASGTTPNRVMTLICKWPDGYETTLATRTV